jgi:hypothetical protein
MPRRGNRRVLVRTGNRDGRTADGQGLVERSPFVAGAHKQDVVGTWRGINEGKVKAPCFVSRNTGLRVCELAQHSNRFRNMLTSPREIVPMPQWVLSCSNCHKVFTHSKINPRSETVPFDPLWPTKPDFPNGGLDLACPNCQTSSIYQRFELMYRPD